MTPLTALLAGMPDAERRAALAELSPADLAALEWCWAIWARPDQLAPGTPGASDPRTNWRTWLLLAGRGAGKSRSSAEAVRAAVEAGERRSIALIGPTADTLRRDQVAAILGCSPPWAAPVFEASQRRVTWPNGAIAHCLSSEEPERIRGLNLDMAWVDELCSLSNQADVWSNLQLALRIPGPKGHDPAAIVSTTPKRQPLLKAIIAAPSTVITRASTFSNSANLAAATLEHLQGQYGGTSLGRQELHGELLDDLDGAMFSRALIERGRVTEAPETLLRVVVGVDPSGSVGRDAVGIVVVGVGPDRHGYVLADLSGQYSPERWARVAVDAYHSFGADRIVAEANFGGAMVESNMRTVDPTVRVKMVTASRGKAVRAEPIVSLYEQSRVHHVGLLAALEDELCSYDPLAGGKSPDRLDAMVWALTETLALPQAKPARMIRLNHSYR